MEWKLPLNSYEKKNIMDCAVVINFVGGMCEKQRGNQRNY